MRPLRAIDCRTCGGSRRVQKGELSIDCPTCKGGGLIAGIKITLELSRVEQYASLQRWMLDNGFDVGSRMPVIEA